MGVLNNHAFVEKSKIRDEKVLSLPRLDIHLDRWKIYRDRKEVNLTVKEYDILHLLAVHRGRVLSYEQIYKNVWGEAAVGNEMNAIGKTSGHGKLETVAVDTGLRHIRLP